MKIQIFQKHIQEQGHWAKADDGTYLAGIDTATHCLKIHHDEPGNPSGYVNEIDMNGVQHDVPLQPHAASERAATAAADQGKDPVPMYVGDEAKMIAKAVEETAKFPTVILEQGGHQVAFQQGMTDVAKTGYVTELVNDTNAQLQKDGSEYQMSAENFTYHQPYRLERLHGIDFKLTANKGGMHPIFDEVKIRDPKHYVEPV